MSAQDVVKVVLQVQEGHDYVLVDPEDEFQRYALLQTVLNVLVVSIEQNVDNSSLFQVSGIFFKGSESQIRIPVFSVSLKVDWDKLKQIIFETKKHHVTMQTILASTASELTGIIFQYIEAANQIKDTLPSEVNTAYELSHAFRRAKLDELWAHFANLVGEQKITLKDSLKLFYLILLLNGKIEMPSKDEFKKLTLNPAEATCLLRIFELKF